MIKDEAAPSAAIGVTGPAVRSRARRRVAHRLFIPNVASHTAPTLIELARLDPGIRQFRIIGAKDVAVPVRRSR